MTTINDDTVRRFYWTEPMEHGYALVQKLIAFPVNECGERFASLRDADKTFHPATAKVEGEKVIVTSPEVKTPIAVRYAWKDIPKANMVNAADLPASPFRSVDG